MTECGLPQLQCGEKSAKLAGSHTVVDWKKCGGVLYYAKHNAIFLAKQYGQNCLRNLHNLDENVFQIDYIILFHSFVSFMQDDNLSRNII